MKKLFAMSALALAAFAATPAIAEDIQTDRDCAQSGEAGAVTPTVVPLAPDEQGNPELLRGSLCVSDGDESNGAELYVGGEIDTEASYDPACGAIEVLGIQGVGIVPDVESRVFGYDNWDNTDCQ